MEGRYSNVLKTALAADSVNCTVRILPLLYRISILIQWEIYDDHRCVKEKESTFAGQ